MRINRYVEGNNQFWLFPIGMALSFLLTWYFFPFYVSIPISVGIAHFLTDLDDRKTMFIFYFFLIGLPAVLVDTICAG